MRHTFASILIAEGKSPAFVQAQLSHRRITLTVDTYGKWLPKGDKAAIDSLDDYGDNTDREGGGDSGGDVAPESAETVAAVASDAAESLSGP